MNFQLVFSNMFDINHIGSIMKVNCRFRWLYWLNFIVHKGWFDEETLDVLVQIWGPVNKVQG